MAVFDVNVRRMSNWSCCYDREEGKEGQYDRDGLVYFLHRLSDPTMMIHPPSLNFGAFHSTHFADPDKRAYFSQLIAQDPQSAAWTAALAPAAPHQHTAAVETRADEAATTDADAVEDVADVLPGETDEQWQERHGFSYLTPAGVRIFDAARVFREQSESSMPQACQSLYLTQPLDTTRRSRRRCRSRGCERSDSEVRRYRRCHPQ